MKFVVAVLLILVVAGCSGESVPTAYSPPIAPTPTPTSALLWVMVIDDYGACIDGATIQIIGPQRAGEPEPPETPCNMWDIDGGLVFKDLTPGVELTLRGAARGYTSGETTFLPFPIPGSYRAVFITLSK